MEFPSFNKSFSVSPRLTYKRTKYEETPFRPSFTPLSGVNIYQCRVLSLVSFICTVGIEYKDSVCLYVCTFHSPFLLKTYFKKPQIVCLYVTHRELENTNSFSGSQA